MPCCICRRGEVDEEAGLAVKAGDHRWAFIRKVYAIVAFQFLITVGVSSAVYFVEPIAHFFKYSHAGLALFIIMCVVSLIVLTLMLCAYKVHPTNLICLVIFTLLQGLTFGVACSFRKGVIIYEASILIEIAVVTLTIYSFWANFRRYDFSLFGPVLFMLLEILIVFALIQIFIPFGKVSEMVFSIVAAVMFIGFLIYDTYNLIEHNDHDQYIIASIAIYLDILNLFVNLPKVFKIC
ncbi:hypothetical protein LUZ60_006667 [Juncus effusus]|nr:hypothetical protein LUZ60_006667 [Juncus effusus]